MKHGNVISVVVALLLLAGIGAERAVYRIAPRNAEPYHAAVRAAAGHMPMAIGNWMGVDVPLPQGAVTLLRPNVLVARRFQDLRSGREFTFLLVHCRDARDMLGHYPPLCYVAQGWGQQRAEQRTWQLGELPIEGMTYTFASRREELPANIIVENFMILPDGTTAREMDDVERAARQRQSKFLGAAQVQFVFDAGDFSDSERSQLLEMVLGANREVIDAIRGGVDGEKDRGIGS